MALDPSIILQAGRGITQFDPIGVTQAAQRFQMQGLQIQQMRQQQEDTAGMRRDIAEAGGDPAALKAALLKRGKVKEVHEMTTAEKQAQEAEAKRAKAHLDSVNGLNQQQLQVYQSALDALDKDPTQAQAIHSFVLGKTLENAKTLFPQMDTSRTDDPPGFQDVTQQRAWLQNKISGAMTFDQRLKMADQAIQEKAASEFGGWHPALGPDNKPGIFQSNKAGEVRQVPGLRPVPPAAAVQVNMGEKLPPGWRQDPENPGAWRPIPGGPHDTKSKDKPLTEAQGNALGFGIRAREADAIMSGLESKGVNPGTIANKVADAVPVVGNYAKSPDIQAIEQAQRNFVTAVLRKESGAAISAGEFDTEAKKYFPQPGDSEKVRQQKANARKTAIEVLQVQAGRDLPEVVKPVKPVKAEASVPPKPKLGAVVDGYVFLGGDPANPKSWKKK